MHAAVCSIWTLDLDWGCVYTESDTATETQRFPFAPGPPTVQLTRPVWLNFLRQADGRHSVANSRQKRRHILCPANVTSPGARQVILSRWTTRRTGPPVQTVFMTRLSGSTETGQMVVVNPWSEIVATLFKDKNFCHKNTMRGCVVKAKQRAHGIQRRSKQISPLCPNKTSSPRSIFYIFFSV